MNKEQNQRWEQQVASRRKPKKHRPANMHEWGLQLVLDLLSLPTEELQAFHDKLKAKLNK